MACCGHLRPQRCVSIEIRQQYGKLGDCLFCWFITHNLLRKRSRVSWLCASADKCTNSFRQVPLSEKTSFWYVHKINRNLVTWWNALMHCWSWLFVFLSSLTSFSCFQLHTCNQIWVGLPSTALRWIGGSLAPSSFLSSHWLSLCWGRQLPSPPNDFIRHSLSAADYSCDVFKRLTGCNRLSAVFYRQKFHCVL